MKKGNNKQKIQTEIVMTNSILKMLKLYTLFNIINEDLVPDTIQDNRLFLQFKKCLRILKFGLNKITYSNLSHWLCVK